MGFIGGGGGGIYNSGRGPTYLKAVVLVFLDFLQKYSPDYARFLAHVSFPFDII
jgi:hypothetical protein